MSQNIDVNSNLIFQHFNYQHFDYQHFDYQHFHQSIYYKSLISFDITGSVIQSED